MSPDESASDAVPVFFTSEFKRNLRQLAKKYRRIKADIQPLLTDIERGHTPGDRIPGLPFELYKARARNSDSVRGKSGGYRIIYQCLPTGVVILITLYSKAEQADIALHEIQAIVTTYEHEHQGTEIPDPTGEPTTSNPDQPPNNE